ncbi:hypothetical protein [Prochlorococcus marinus]|uniref:hypothetical protein n=1 Tax=Prochlorococcus marinus TaxID=1219 RepID=UPI0022B31E9A|nr:hypothetical protein [Prochlorococcus marinus]
MSLEFYVLVIPFCIIPVLLVSLDYLNKNTELKRENDNVIDFDKFVKRKAKGDAVDSDIAKLLDIDKIAA